MMMLQCITCYVTRDKERIHLEGPNNSERFLRVRFLKELHMAHDLLLVGHKAKKEIMMPPRRGSNLLEANRG